MDGYFMKHNKLLDNISIILVLLGAICWGLIGAFGFDLIGSVFDTDAGMMSPITRVIYVVVGLSAIYRIVLWAQCRCK
jgi:uncharacterized membrane protein YuzA (DUF378 family)